MQARLVPMLIAIMCVLPALGCHSKYVVHARVDSYPTCELRPWLQSVGNVVVDASRRQFFSARGYVVVQAPTLSEQFGSELAEVVSSAIQHCGGKVGVHGEPDLVVTIEDISLKWFATTGVQADCRIALRATRPFNGQSLTGFGVGEDNYYSWGMIMASSSQDQVSNALYQALLGLFTSIPRTVQ